MRPARRHGIVWAVRSSGVLQDGDMYPDTSLPPINGDEIAAHAEALVLEAAHDCLLDPASCPGLFDERA